MHSKQARIEALASRARNAAANTTNPYEAMSRADLHALAHQILRDETISDPDLLRAVEGALVSSGQMEPEEFNAVNRAIRGAHVGTVNPKGSMNDFIRGK